MSGNIRLVKAEETPGNTRTYSAFLSSKMQLDGDSGFKPSWIPSFLFDFQSALVEWAIPKGRGGIFADCGLGKTPMQLVWAQNVLRHTNKPVLIITPLAVSRQTVREAVKFGVECRVSKDGKHKGGIVVTNYERLHYFNPQEFSGVVCDESSIIKNFAGKRKKEITEFMRLRPYRLLCTATAAPNDYWELGTSSEALGYLGFQDMLSRFFKEDTINDWFGWGRKSFRFRGHAEDPFWRWVCSWARTCRKPSDLGFPDDRFKLPPLKEIEHVIHCHARRNGMLFAVPARDLHEQREERRLTLEDRCAKVAELIGDRNGVPTVSWCHLNKEADRLEQLIPDALQVSGSMPDELKEERLLAFQDGELQHLVTKPKIGCFGLNWQHCHYVTLFPSHSWEQYYQAIRRCWRFGQKHPVEVNIITTDGERAVLRNLQRKATQSDLMFTKITQGMRNSLDINRSKPFADKARRPSWMYSSSA